MTARRISLWLLLAILVIAGVFFLQYRRRSVVEVRTAKVERQSIHASVVTNGKAEPLSYREVRSEVEGEVVRVLVPEGETVRRGQTLLELNQRQALSELEQARSELAEAENAWQFLQRGGTENEVRELRAQWEEAKRERDQAAAAVARNERLLEKGAVARMELEQSRARLAKAEADLAVLDQKWNRPYSPEELGRAQARVRAAQAVVDLGESRLRATAVVSPLDGVVYSRAVRAGDYVRTGDLLASVGELGQMRVRVYVDEPDLGRVARGQAVLVRWDGLPEREWKGQVERLPSEIKQLDARRVGEVICTLDNPGRALLPNMNLNVEIVTESREGVLTLPREAILGADTNRYVYLIREGVLARQAVEGGLLNPTRIEIREGLQEGEEVALAGAEPLREGMRVRSDSQEFP
ncbi:MAG: efflux RND transporter periplasmic adaptor subunit [Acidobacteria bacterium]|nr:efflux RND transporter periplasmic adaptor subunit [Acidobacteriota bacterium]